MTSPYILVLLCVLALTAGQILFKAVSGRLPDVSLWTPDSTTLGLLASALVLYAGSTLLWILALRQLPLSQAYPFMGLGFILVPIASHFIFGERVGVPQYLGAVLVVAGIIVSSR